jgi:hypothetical protein
MSIKSEILWFLRGNPPYKPKGKTPVIVLYDPHLDKNGEEYIHPKWDSRVSNFNELDLLNKGENYEKDNNL